MTETSPHPTATEIQAAIAVSTRAPSVHNTQPWLWRVGSHSVDLFSDPARALPVEDPQGRLMLVSCGAALDHLTIAMAASGWRPTVVRFPDPADPHHVASLTFEPAAPDPRAAELAAAIHARRTDRRPMSSWSVPTSYLDRLVQVAAERGALAKQLTGEVLTRWNLLSGQAISEQDSPEYQRELDEWTHRPEQAHDGIPAANRLALDESRGLAVNPFPAGSLHSPPRSSYDDPQPAGLLLGTSSDDQLARLRVGEAMSAVLLEATRAGLATAIDTQVLELADTRSKVEADLLDGHLSPQVLLIVGWPSPGGTPPTTPRRDVADLVTSTVDADVLSE